MSPELLQADQKTLELCTEPFARLEKIKEYNQLKMLRAFTDCGVGAHHLVGTTGYGYDDAGRIKLEEVFAKVVGAEASLFRYNFMSGTHTLTVALFGVLRPGDTMVAATGRPYDTLLGVIGLEGEGYGSLKEWGVHYDEVPLLANSQPDLAGIEEKCKNAKMCYIQRSRGYAARGALSLDQIEACLLYTSSSGVNYLCNRQLPYVQDKSFSGSLPRYYLLWLFQLAASIGGAYLLCVFAQMDEMAAKLLVDIVPVSYTHLDVDGIGDVRLRDVAAVELTDNAGETYAKVNGNDGVVLSFQKQSTASTADVSGKINDAIEELQQENPDLHITPLMDQGDYIDLVVSLSLIHI